MTGPLRPVKSETDPELSTWYKRSSQVWVAANHACWTDEELLKKVKKRRFGYVVRSPYADLGRMMDEHADEVHNFVRGRLTPDDEEDEDEDENEKEGTGAGANGDEPPAKGSRAPAAAVRAGQLGVRSGNTTEDDK